MRATTTLYHPLLLPLLLAACSGGSKPPAGQSCSLPSDCNSPLICSFGRCHTACREARDCPMGQRCVKSSAGNVCQLPDDLTCTSGAQCQAPLTCAPDGQCRSDCSADNACPTPTQRCLMPERICAETDELDPGTGRLRNAPVTPVPGPDGGAAADGPPPADAAPAGSCNDKAKNGAETDVDCGGSCPACAVGKSCGAPADCASSQCIGGKCLECKPDSTKCVGQKQATCMGGLWVTANNDCAQGCDAMTGACRMCPASTCRSVKVIFHGAIEGNPDVQLAVDDGKTYRTDSDTDAMIGMKNVLYGNFTMDRKQYTTDNTTCSLPDFGKRTNVYYLAPVEPLGVAASWYSSSVDFMSVEYCQSCPNFGCGNFISTPKRVGKIEILANSGDLSCKVCLYKESPAASTSLVRCVSPNTTLSGADLTPMTAPLVLQLDDGKRCGSY